MFELMLLRHGKAKQAEEAHDRERPLKNRGKRSAQRLGVLLQEQGMYPDLVLSSTADRAIETAGKCIKSMGLPTSRIELDERLYSGSSDAVMAAIVERSARCNRLLAVGHNPVLDQLVKQLIHGRALPGGNGFHMQKGMLVHMRLPETGALPLTHEGQLEQCVDAQQLPEHFPWPGPGGPEQRERPAYYYTQSAVVPYRFTSGGRLEILLITSSSGRSWVVPKGIVEPGYSPQDSAAKEAWEEAGIEGRVHPELLGCYRHHKWGAECDVSLFAMHVDNMVGDSDWQEDHRQRRWCGIDHLTQADIKPELKALIERLPAQLKESGLWPA